jgi:uncharacterized protein
MFLFSPLFLKSDSKAPVKLFIHNICAILFLVSLFSAIGLGFVYIICYMNGVEMSSLNEINENSSIAIRNCTRLLALVSHICFFILPAIAFTYIQEGKNWHTIFKFKCNHVRIKVALLSLLLLIVAFPLAQYLYKINNNLPLPASWAQSDVQTTQKLMHLMVMPSLSELLINLLTIAVIPAIGEEMIFRGLIQQTLIRCMKSDFWAIGLGALLFSTLHFQFLGFLPRVLLGFLLGYIFYWSKNLWYSILAHGFFNGLQVVVLYIHPEHIQQLTPSKVEINLPAAMGSVVLMVLIGALLRREARLVV